MKVDIYGIDGKVKGNKELPSVFEEEVREDLIIRAVLHEESKERQPKGTHPLAGLQTTAEYIGRKESYRAIKNRGISRLPREKLPKGRFGRVRIVPFSVGGRRAHPPKPEKVLVEKMNKKEYRKALRSAIAATAKEEVVLSRGHLADGVKLPIIVERSFEDLRKTKEVFAFIKKLGLEREIERAKKRTKRRTGTAGRRKGGKVVPKTLLVVAPKGKRILKAADNLPGVDVTTPKDLQVRALAPGGKPGRLTLWTEGAIEELMKW